ncbi:hypothetical protein [Povalibacter sp.]|uniref:hypothetical protein n=1 Tax=Povalibacter sp. TaxID=1962978 RepID=UPI002F405CCA
MALGFSSAVLDEHIAPGASQFNHAEIPDASEFSAESAHWVSNYFLNCTFRGKFKPPMNAYAFNYLRRCQVAFSEHTLARTSTQSFLSAGGQSPRAYADALFHWESFLGQAWHAFAILMKAWSGTAFNKDDGSVEQRLNALYNQMKHVESRIENGQLLPGATVPVWLENQGIRSTDAHLSFKETAEVLKELAKYADALCDPITAKDKFKDEDA